LLRYKDTKVRLKSLISAVFFMVCINAKKLISLDKFLVIIFFLILERPRYKIKAI